MFIPKINKAKSDHDHLN